ncbi:NADP-dependent oxidoreductase [Janibacter sp. GS2]|uniref:NADP-dependent oxidoreductase n=1 Tax=Janibacter sp. GS2 TaxID=3442646 RepID=UPI003EBDB483
MTTTPTSTRHFVLASRPHGAPTNDNFRLETAEVPDLSDGQVLVRNEVMSVDPYMRGRMNDVKSYVPPFQIDAPLEGGAVGEVIASRSDDVAVGSHVVHGLGWREHAVLPAKGATVVDTDIAPASAYLGLLGMPGLTAYVGLTAVAEMREGDTVFISGAAGAVGQVAGQIAKLLGAERVVGSAGSAEKVERLLELGYDAAFNYKEKPVAEGLREVAPDGIDVYFDNVGGDHLEAAISALRLHGRVALCGAVSQYNATEAPAGPRNLFQAIGKGLTLRGFIVGQYPQLAAEYRAKAAGWLAEGRLRGDETFRDGLDGAPQAFIDLLEGANTGKMLVRL